VALVGLVVGALVGGVGRLDTGDARDLSQLFHNTGPQLDGLSADLVIVERGFHEAVPERIYSGSIDYIAPEQLSIELVDTTSYPTDEWLPNDVEMAFSNGDTVVVAGSPCPVAALPGCLVEPTTRALVDQPPFDDGVLRPLEIVGPGRSLNWPSDIEVVGLTSLEGRAAIQVKSTVAAVELIGAITDNGAWRDLHPTDPVVMWLDEETLVPLRIEVFASNSPERELWQLRRGYDDDPRVERPVLIVELSRVVTRPGEVAVEAPDGAPSGGFVDIDVALVTPVLPEGFEPHRSGRWQLGDGGEVEVATWSDGRSWLMVETTADWEEPGLFGLSTPFVEPIELGHGSLAYVAPTGDTLAIHGESRDLLISGTVPRAALLEAAASLDVPGVKIPEDWLQGSTVEIERLPAGTLVPDAEGWSVLGRVGEGETTLLMTGSGTRSVLVTQSEGTRLEPPTGPDYSEVTVRGATGRYDASTATLEWVEDDRIVRMRSDTVAMDDLLELAATLEPR
jgi:hypothetical protein